MGRNEKASHSTAAVLFRIVDGGVEDDDGAVLVNAAEGGGATAAGVGNLGLS